MDVYEPVERPFDQWVSPIDYIFGKEAHQLVLYLEFKRNTYILKVLLSFAKNFYHPLIPDTRILGQALAFRMERHRCR